MRVDDPGTFGLFPNLAFDRAGHGLLTWTVFDSATNGTSLVSNRYNAIDGTWGSSTSLQATANVSFQNAIAFDLAGNAFAVWDQSDGTAVT